MTPGEDGLPRIDRKKCTTCGERVDVCRPGALAIYRKKRSVDEVFQVVCKDRAFYGADGGVTASAGEPLQRLVSR